MKYGFMLCLEAELKTLPDETATHCDITNLSAGSNDFTLNQHPKSSADLR